MAVNYTEIAYQLGLIAEQIETLKEEFTPDQDEHMAHEIISAETHVKLAENHALYCAERLE